MVLSGSVLESCPIAQHKESLHYILTANGLKFAFDVKTTLNISDIAFYPSQTTHSYDIYASSIDKEDILFLDLTTGKRLISHIVQIEYSQTTQIAEICLRDIQKTPKKNKAFFWAKTTFSQLCCLDFTFLSRFILKTRVL